MSDEIEWGPWIEHDGGAGPNVTAPVEITHLGAGIAPKNGEYADCLHPSYIWKWKTVRVGWFRRERRRVCDNPAYAPIIRYRIGKHKGRSAAMDRLAEIVDMPHRPITAPEGPTREKVPANKTRDRA